MLVSGRVAGSILSFSEGGAEIHRKSTPKDTVIHLFLSRKPEGAWIPFIFDDHLL